MFNLNLSQGSREQRKAFKVILCSSFHEEVLSLFYKPAHAAVSAPPRPPLFTRLQRLPFSVTAKLWP